MWQMCHYLTFEWFKKNLEFSSYLLLSGSLAHISELVFHQTVGLSLAVCKKSTSDMEPTIQQFLMYLMS